MPKTLYSRALLASACALAFTLPAHAQEAAEEADPNVIIVTAQNRSQNVNDVPIAINVVTGEQLQQAGFSNLNDVGKIAPVVQLNQDQGTVKITVRGVGTTSNDEAQDTSVVVNVDGEYINRPNVLGVSMFDIDRVEVLRGPQGTLYGRNSTGGAINFITRKPGKDFGVNLSGSYGNYDAVRLDGGVDVPAGDVAAFRLSGFYEQRDGYVYHPDIKKRSDDNQAYGGRATLRLDPTDALSISVAGEYAERHFSPAVFAATNLNGAGNGPTGPGCNASGYVEVAPAYSQTLCVPANTNFLSSIDRGSFNAPLFGIGQIDQKTWAVRGHISYEFSPAATLSYTGGYRNYEETSFRPLPIIYRSFTFEDKAKTQSHELRLNGEIGGVIYQVGGFYFKETLNRESGFFLPIGGPNGTFLSYFGRDISSDSKSAFGQVEVPIVEAVTFVGGLRYTKNSRNAVYLNGGPFFNAKADIYKGTTPPPGGAPDFYLLNGGPGRKDFSKMKYLQTLLLGSEEDKVTWLGGVNYKPNSDTLVFAKVSTGFKGGGFDAVGDYKPETNTAYELGWKQSFGPSSQHQFNLGGFYYDYKDLQVSVLLDTTVGGQTFNAGKAKIWGIEASGSFKLSDNDTFSASAQYLNAEYKDLKAQFNVYTVPGTGTDVNGVGDLDPTTAGVQQPNFAGNTPPFSPQWVITAGYDHVFDFGSAGTVTASAYTTFKSSYYTDFYNYRDGQQKAFTQTDLSLLYKPENEKFSLMAFVKNLENERPLTYGSFVSAGPDDIYNWAFGTPRTYGVRFSVDF